MAAGKKVGCALLTVLALGGATCGLGLLAAGPVLTHMARGRLGEAGIACDDRLAVGLAPEAASLTVGPTYCRVAEGPIEAIELLAPAQLAPASSTTLRAVAAEDVRVTLREGVLPQLEGAAGLGATGLGVALSALAVPERVYGLVQVVSALAARPDVPRIELGRLEVVRAGGRVATLTGATFEGPSPARARVAQVALPVHEGPFGVRAEATLSELEVQSDGARATVSGALGVDASLPFVGGRLATERLTVEVSGLDGGAPRVRVVSP